MPAVYCSGPLMGCSWLEATAWRSEARRLLAPLSVNDPAERWAGGGYEGLTQAEKLAIVDRDLEQIGNSDGVLCCVWKPSVGTSQEIVYSTLWRIPTVVVTPTLNYSPWLLAHCDLITTDLVTGCNWLREKLGTR